MGLERAGKSFPLWRAEPSQTMGIFSSFFFFFLAGKGISQNLPECRQGQSGVPSTRLWRNSSFQGDFPNGIPESVALLTGCPSLLRCWDLSAGNLKWIIQVPILAAIVVSTAGARAWGGPREELIQDFPLFPLSKFLPRHNPYTPTLRNLCLSWNFRSCVWQEGLWVASRREKPHIFRCEAPGSSIKPTFRAIFPTQVILENLRGRNVSSPGVSNGKRWNLEPVAGPKIFPGIFWANSVLSELTKAWEA